MLKQLFEWYLQNQTELVKLYNGKFLVIKDFAVADAFDDEQEALDFASEKYGLGNFIIQQCTPGADSYTQTFHSRVVFA